MSLAQYAKAIIGALIAFLTAVGTGLTDGSMSPAEWVAAAVAGLVALGAVFAVPNAAPRAVRDARGRFRKRPTTR